MLPADRSNLFHYNKKLQLFANENRKNMTKAEACLWKYALSSKQMMGYQFRRQRPVLEYIADFMCKELKLIIEIDGITHHWEEIADKHLIREERLKSAGFKLLRFTDDEVVNDIPNVIRTIENYIFDFSEGNKKL